MGPWVVMWCGLHPQMGCTGVIDALRSGRSSPRRGLSNGDGQRPDTPWMYRQLSSTAWKSARDTGSRGWGTKMRSAGDPTRCRRAIRRRRARARDPFSSSEAMAIPMPVTRVARGLHHLLGSHGLPWPLLYRGVAPGSVPSQLRRINVPLRHVHCYTFNGSRPIPQRRGGVVWSEF